MPTPAELRAEALRLLDEADRLAEPITAESLRTMTPDEVVKAQADGRLDAILKGGS